MNIISRARNRLMIHTSKVEAASDSSSWFNGLSKKQQEQYLEMHPNSKLTNSHYVRLREEGKTPEPGKNWKEHAKIKNSLYHKMASFDHFKKSHDLNKKIMKELNPKGMKNPWHSKSFNEKYDSHPLKKEMDKHILWSDKHEQKAIDLEDR